MQFEPFPKTFKFSGSFPPHFYSFQSKKPFPSANDSIIRISLNHSWKFKLIFCFLKFSLLLRQLSKAWHIEKGNPVTFLPTYFPSFIQNISPVSLWITIFHSLCDFSYFPQRFSLKIEKSFKLFELFPLTIWVLGKINDRIENLFS